MPGGIHHSVVVVRDLEASLRFYRDGIGLDLSQDRHVEGDWPDLFDAPSDGASEISQDGTRVGGTERAADGDVAVAGASDPAR